jgi:PadR family transcriptional regulator, regulatory protein PadR
MPHATADIPPGTLHMLILKTLQRGPLHGYAIAQRIHLISQDVLRVEEGSLYPALQRMLIKGWVTADWSQSESGRRVRLYRLTTAGKKQLGTEISEFDRVMKAVYKVIEAS